jgi:TM2 domain-containing membrane protein YozV
MSKALKNSSEKQPVSAHRAIVYSASLPGWGEYYGGARARGLITGALFVLFVIWFFKLFIEIAIKLTDHFAIYLQGTAGTVLPDFSIPSFGTAMIGMYFIWLWAIISSVDVAIKNRRKEGKPFQTSTIWAIGISWLCPGAGQVYTRHRFLGYGLFIAYLAGMLLIIPVYMRMGESLSDIVKNSGLYAADPLSVMGIIKEIMAGVNYSFAKLFQEAVRYLAIAKAAQALKNWWYVKDSFLRGLALFAMGWLCPGSGQFLQGRATAGWWFFAAYLSARFLIGFLLGAGGISIENMELLAWGPTIIKLSAMIDAPVSAARRQEFG